MKHTEEKELATVINLTIDLMNTLNFITRDKDSYPDARILSVGLNDNILIYDTDKFIQAAEELDRVPEVVESNLGAGFEDTFKGFFHFRGVEIHTWLTEREAQIVEQYIAKKEEVLDFDEVLFAEDDHEVDDDTEGDEDDDD